MPFDIHNDHFYYYEMLRLMKNPLFFRQIAHIKMSQNLPNLLLDILPKPYNSTIKSRFSTYRDVELFISKLKDSASTLFGQGLYSKSRENRLKIADMVK